MQTSTFLYILIALFSSLFVAYFQYYYRVQNRKKVTGLLFSLRAFSLFLLLLLLINPTIEKKEIENEKSVLTVLVDNSSSTKFLKQEKNVTSFLAQLQNHQSLNNKFEVRYFTFGSRLEVLDSLSFQESQTNINQAIANVNNLYKDRNATQILISDGNQTLGNSYEYRNSKQVIYPFVIGDTTLYRDVKITQLNVNKYNYIKNKFPVEVLLNYEGNEVVNTQFSIAHQGKIVFRKQLQFSSKNTAQTVTANLQSNKEGIQYYTASVQKLSDEKNTKNNTKGFSIEVLDEQTKVLILTSVMHPDVGTLKKAIESNKQRTATIKNIENKNIKINDFQLIILYQPNNKFNIIFNQLKEKKQNYLMISGRHTNWNFINKQGLGFTKSFINQTENYTASYHDQFLTFFQKDIGFASFPPLTDLFGEITLSKNPQILLHQNTNGIATKQPLLASFREGNHKWATVFGEGIWKWRATSYLENNNFEAFDAFMGNFIQYLASKKVRKRLEVTTENLFASNETVTMTAFYVDENYQFDARASLWLNLVHQETKKTKRVPFSLANNSYQIAVENLEQGTYTYRVTVDNQKINKSGQFKITNYNVEAQFTNANKKALGKLANRTGGKCYYVTQEAALIKDLVNNPAYFTTQKTITKKEDLIAWKWVLISIASLLSIEWFVRKYYGEV